MSNPYSAQNLWGMQPPAVKMPKANIVIVPPAFGGGMPLGEAQTMRMKSAIKASLIPLSCAGAACIVR
jgi:hypothetical protein